MFTRTPAAATSERCCYDNYRFVSIKSLCDLRITSDAYVLAIPAVFRASSVEASPLFTQALGVTCYHLLLYVPACELLYPVAQTGHERLGKYLTVAFNKALIEGSNTYITVQL